MTLHMPHLRLIGEGEYPDPDTYPIGGLCAFCGHETGKVCECDKHGGCEGEHGELTKEGVMRLYEAVMEGDRRHD